MATGTPVPYLIQLSDTALAQQYQTTYPTGFVGAPAAAAATFGAPIGGQTPGGALTPPAITIPYFGYNFTPYVAAATFSTPENPSQTFFWVGYFLYAGTVPAAGQPPAVTGTRRFIVGFETNNIGEGGSGGVVRSARAASRTPDGFGYAYRSNNNDSTLHSLPTPYPDSSSERFYICLRTLPAGGNDMVWSVQGSIEGAGPTIHLDVNPAGQLLLYNQGNAGAPGTLLFTTVALALNTWTRVDVRWAYVPLGTPATPIPAGTIALAINGVSLGSVGAVTYGVGVIGQKHQSSSIGNLLASSHGLEADLDDWVNADTLNLATGSHISLLHPNGFAPSHSSSWVGDFRQLLPNPAKDAAAADALITSTPSAVCAVTTDYTPVQSGCAAFLVSCYLNAGTGTGQLSLSLDGSATVASVSLNATSWVTMFVPLGATKRYGAVNLALTKDSGAGATKVNALVATMESIGAWGPEDVPGALPLVGIHDAPYPGVVGSQSAVQTYSPVTLQSGVYTGNAAGQDLLTGAPVHWFWVRPLASDTGGTWWWSTCVAAAARLDSLLKPVRMVLAKLFGMGGSLSLAGSDAQSNGAGVSYQWISVSDPGHRYVLNGAFQHDAGVAAASNPLQDASFTPEALFATVEDHGTSATKHWFKGIGHTTDTASKLDGAVTSGVASLAAGAITSKTPIHIASTLQVAYSAWRRTDAAAYTGVFDLVTYTGDGTGTRNIPCVLKGNSPLFAIVTPHNGGSYFRDPSHLTTHSSQMAGTDSTTGIVGGDLNIVTVGSTLNANAIVYDLFVIPGIPNAGGWSPNPVGPWNPVPPYPPGVTIPSPSPAPSPTPTPPTPQPQPPGGGIACLLIEPLY